MTVTSTEKITTKRFSSAVIQPIKDVWNNFQVYAKTRGVYHPHLKQFEDRLPYLAQGSTGAVEAGMPRAKLEKLYVEARRHLAAHTAFSQKLNNVMLGDYINTLPDMARSQNRRNRWTIVGFRNVSTHPLSSNYRPVVLSVDATVVNYYPRTGHEIDKLTRGSLYAMVKTTNADARLADRVLESKPFATVIQNFAPLGISKIDGKNFDLEKLMAGDWDDALQSIKNGIRNSMSADMRPLLPHGVTDISNLKMLPDNMRTMHYKSSDGLHEFTSRLVAPIRSELAIKLSTIPQTAFFGEKWGWAADPLLKLSATLKQTRIGGRMKFLPVISGFVATGGLILAGRQVMNAKGV